MLHFVLIRRRRKKNGCVKNWWQYNDKSIYLCTFTIKIITMSPCRRTLYRWTLNNIIHFISLRFYRFLCPKIFISNGNVISNYLSKWHCISSVRYRYIHSARHWYAKCETWDWQMLIRFYLWLCKAISIQSWFIGTCHIICGPIKCISLRYGTVCVSVCSILCWLFDRSFNSKPIILVSNDFDWNQKFEALD